jgi:hypothetical protein
MIDEPTGMSYIKQTSKCLYVCDRVENTHLLQQYLLEMATLTTSY